MSTGSLPMLTLRFADACPIPRLYCVGWVVGGWWWGRKVAGVGLYFPIHAQAADSYGVAAGAGPEARRRVSRGSIASAQIW